MTAAIKAFLLGASAALAGCYAAERPAPVASVRADASPVVVLALHGRRFCHGVRVGPHTVLTAAHCLTVAMEAGADGALVIGAGRAEWCEARGMNEAADIGTMRCPTPGPWAMTAAIPETVTRARVQYEDATREVWARPSRTYPAFLRRVDMWTDGGCWPGESGSPVLVNNRVVAILIAGGDPGGHCTAVAALTADGSYGM